MLTKPVITKFNAGFANPKDRLKLDAVTLKIALLTASIADPLLVAKLEFPTKVAFRVCGPAPKSEVEKFA